MIGIPMILSMSDPAAGSTIGGTIMNGLQTAASPLSASDIGTLTGNTVNGFIATARKGGSHRGGMSHSYVSGGGPIFLPYN